MSYTYVTAKTARAATASIVLCAATAGAAQSPSDVYSYNGDLLLDLPSPSPQEYVTDPAVKRWVRFQALANEWRRERGAMSSVTGMAMLPAYQKIIGLGEDAIPLILAALKSEGDEPDQWFWALRAITDANPVSPEDQGDTVKMAAAWLKWAEEEGYGW